MRRFLLVFPAMLLVFGASSCTSARAKLRANVLHVTPARTALPFPPGAIDVGFVAGPTHIYVSWLDAAAESKGTLRVAAWDGTEWAAAETIAADVDLVAAGGRKPTLGVRSDGTRVAHWFDRRDLQADRSAWFAVSTDGGPWSSPARLPSTIGEGFAPLAWSDVTLPPSAVWIAPHKQPLRAAADGVFVAIPNPRDSSQMQVGLIEPRVSFPAGVETQEIGPGFFVDYLAETKVDEAGFLAAFRKLGRLNTPTEDVAHVEVVFVPRDGRSLVLFAGEGDRLKPDARGARPELVLRGRIPWVGYYTPKAGGEIRMFPLLHTPLKARTGGSQGEKFLCLDPVQDFRLDVLGGRLAIATLEGGNLLVRRQGRIERLNDALLPEGSRIEWFGHLGDRHWIAWVEPPGRLVFAALP